MRSPLSTHSEIIGALAGFKTQPSVVFSDRRGRILVGAKNLTGIPGLSDGPEVFFVAEKPGEEPRQASSIREALWVLGIPSDERVMDAQQDDCA